MRIETTSTLYYTIRNNFADCVHWDADRHDKFKEMLAEYDASINTSRRNPDENYICDHMGIIPGIDFVEFPDGKLYTMFILKWT